MATLSITKNSITTNLTVIRSGARGPSGSGSTFTVLPVADEAERLALTYEQAAGKIVKQSDDDTSWGLLAGGDPSVSGDWVSVGGGVAAALMVADEAARLALDALDAAGRVVVQEDDSTAWLLSDGGDPSVSGDWLQIATGGASAYADLTDAASVDLPAVNTPLATALSGKLSVSTAASTYQPLSAVLTATTASFTTAIDTRLANTSGTNTGDNAVNSLYSALVSNATHTGDATGSTALTVVKINGTLMSGLATGILKNTTGTGVPSIAVASDFPTLNQDTTGTATYALAAGKLNMLGSGVIKLDSGGNPYPAVAGTDFLTPSTATGLTSFGIRSTAGVSPMDLKFANADVTTTDKTITWVTGNASRTITLSGNPTMGDWFNQSVKTSDTVSFSFVQASGFKCNGGTGLLLGLDGSYSTGIRVQSFVDGTARIGNIGNTGGVYFDITTSGTLKLRNYTNTASTGNLDIGGTLAVTGITTATGGIVLGTKTVGTLPTASSNTYLALIVTDALAPVVGATVAAGGSAKATVRSNGTNYLVTEVL